MNFYLLFVTVPNIKEGKKIAKTLITNKLAACVNIIKKIYSIYLWKGNIEENTEYLLILKTKESKVDLIFQEIKKIHTYDEPECIGFRIEKGSETYLKWIKNVLD